MVGVARLLQLTLFVSTSHAFYIYPPAYDFTDSTKGVGGRSVPAEPETPIGEGLTLELHRRVPNAKEDEASRTERAVREAKRLAQKYAPLEEQRASVSRQGIKLIGRANEYKVVKPVQTTTVHSAGIYHDESDFSYFVQVLYGSSKKPLYMLLDTGAGTSWVMGSNCKSEACTIHDTFGKEDSKTLVTTNEEFALAYGTGQVSGHLAHDAVSVAGMNFEFQFGLAETTSTDFNHFPFDGILGLAMSKGRTDNFLQELKENKLLKSNIFSVSLGRYADGVNVGQVTFGGIDSSKYTGDISYTALSKQNGDWSIPMEDMGYDDKVAQLADKAAYIDTGTSFMFGNPTDVAAVHKLIPGSSTEDYISYNVPCDSKALTLTFSGVTYKIQPNDWIVRYDGGICKSNIFGNEVVKGSWLVGDVFLKNVYTVFDVDKRRIGFAKKSAPPPPPTTTQVPSATAVSDSPGSTGTSTSGPVLSPPGGDPAVSPQPGNNEGDSAGAETPASTDGVEASGDRLQKSTYGVALCLAATVCAMLL